MSVKLLSYDELKTFLNSKGEHKKARIVTDALNKTIFMRNVNDVLYVEDTKRNYYTQIIGHEIEGKIRNKVTLLMESSVEKLTKDQHKEFKLGFGALYTKCVKNSGVNEYMDQLKEYLTIDESDEFIKNLDNTKGEIHFYNGYIDIKTQKFKQRDIRKKPVTYVIPRNYTPSRRRDRRKIFDRVLKTIFPNSDDLTIVLLILGSALTGISTIDQSSLFWLGDGSNGKSLLMSLVESAFDGYVYALMESTFESGNKDKNKILNSFLIYKYIRLAWVNEFSAKPIDESIFKSFVDGCIRTTSLYKEGTNTINHWAKIIATMNKIPNFIVAKSMTRRIDTITGLSSFVDNIDEVDETKQIYLKDKNLKNEIIENGLLDAIVDIIVEYGSRWMDGEKIEPSKNKNMRDSANTIKDGNDKMQDFTDKYLIHTNDSKDRINKSTMYEMYKQHKPKSLITLVQLIDSLKNCDEKIEYNKDLRNKDNTRGAFIGVKIRSQDDIKDDESEQLTIDQQIEILENQKYGIEQQITKLKQQKPITKKDFDLPEEKPKKTKTITKVTTTETVKTVEIDDYDNDEHFPITKDDFDVPTETKPIVKGLKDYTEFKDDPNYQKMLQKHEKLKKEIEEDDRMRDLCDDAGYYAYRKQLNQMKQFENLVEQKENEKQNKEIKKKELTITKDFFDIPEEKPKKSKTKVIKATTVYIDPDNGKQYECDGFELTDDGISLF